MTRDDFQRYFDTLLPLLRLSHWTIKVHDETPNEGEWASVFRVEGRYLATIRLSGDILEETPENIRNTAVHELLHCHMAHHDRMVGDALHRADYDQWRLSVEYLVDALAQTIAPFIPLPEVAKPKAEKPKTQIPEYLWDEQ